MRDESRLFRWRPRLYRVAGCLSFAILVVGLLRSGHSRATSDVAADRPSVLPRRSQSPLDLSGGVIVVDLGAVMAGGRAERRVVLRNDSRRSLEITKIVTSCPCLAVDLHTRQIAPGVSVPATIRIDLSRERRFTGGLSPEFWCLDASGAECFTGSVEATVVTDQDRLRLQSAPSSSAHPGASER